MFETAITAKQVKYKKIVPQLNKYLSGKEVSVDGCTFKNAWGRCDKYKGYDYKIYLSVNVHYPYEGFRPRSGRSKSVATLYQEIFLKDLSKYFSLTLSDFIIHTNYKRSKKR